MRILSAGFAGVIFGAGLTLSEMVNPKRVAGFLDIAGEWDPTLAFVMAGALLVTSAGFRIVLRRPAPVLAQSFERPTREDVDRSLLAGSALFGVGWGISGFCPGPAVAGLASGGFPVAVFVVSMLAGMAIFERWRRPLARAVLEGNRRAA